MFVKNFLSKIFTRKLPTEVKSPIVDFIQKGGHTEVNLSELLANNIKNKKNG